MDGEVTNKFKRICVFCGSKSGNKRAFSDAALDLGHELVKRRIDLVYGGGSVGLMGLISKTVFEGGCHVLGVIPAALMPYEISGEAVGAVKTVSDMHERKAEMARQADAFIALPGGYGTMEELLEMIAWSQLGIHNKPVGLLNVDGYYNPLLALFDNGVEEGFIKPTARDIVISSPNAKDLIEKMEQYIPLHEQVVPSQRWEITRLGYSKLTSPSTSANCKQKIGGKQRVFPHIHMYPNACTFHVMWDLETRKTMQPGALSVGSVGCNLMDEGNSVESVP